MNKKIYLEWMLILADYLECIKKNEVIFEIIVPIMIAAASIVICTIFGLSKDAVTHLNNLVPNILAILIGFSISTIAIIVSTSDDPEKIINKCMERTISGKCITFKQWFLLNFIHFVIAQTGVLMFSFFSPLACKLLNSLWAFDIVLFIYVFSLLYIFSGITKTITKFYFVAFKDASV